MSLSRLENPRKLDIPNIQELDQKISDCMFKLALSPKEGGDPFVYSIAAAKNHYLVDDDFCKTAATNGRAFFWNPTFLSSLSLKATVVVMKHEVYHVCLKHVNRGISVSSFGGLWNIAIDYVVNSIIEHESPKDNKFDWEGSIGKPISIKE